MSQTTLLLILALLFVSLLALALLVWAVWVRRFVRRSGGRTASPYSMTALIADFSTSLTYGRGHLPWSIRLFALILILMAADAVFAVLLVLIGS
jgi:hypothetical protein